VALFQVVHKFVACVPTPSVSGSLTSIDGLFVWLVADGWCWFVLREKYCCLVAGGWFVLREKYCWLVADKPSEQALWPFRQKTRTRSVHVS
jgi:hypothetical protein